MSTDYLAKGVHVQSRGIISISMVFRLSSISCLSTVVYFMSFDCHLYISCLSTVIYFVSFVFLSIVRGVQINSEGGGETEGGGEY